MTWPCSSFFWIGLPSGVSWPAGDQSQAILVATPPRANSGVGQLWQASLLVWLLSSSTLSEGCLCGLSPWQLWQVAALRPACTVSPRSIGPCGSEAVMLMRLPAIWWPSDWWQVAQVKPAPPLALLAKCTSSSLLALLSEESRSPCFTPSPPPPL